MLILLEKQDGLGIAHGPGSIMVNDLKRLISCPRQAPNGNTAPLSDLAEWPYAVFTVGCRTEQLSVKRSCT